MEVYENNQSSKKFNPKKYFAKAIFFQKVWENFCVIQVLLKCCSLPGVINLPVLIDHRSFAHFPSQPLFFFILFKEVQALPQLDLFWKHYTVMADLEQHVFLIWNRFCSLEPWQSAISKQFQQLDGLHFWCFVGPLWNRALLFISCRRELILSPALM